MLQGMKIAALEDPWSTTVSMASCPFAFGSWVMRSKATMLNGHVEGLPGMWYSRVFFLVVCILFFLAGCTPSNIVFYPGIHPWPPVVLGDKGEGVVPPWVSSGWGIVKLCHEFSS